MNYGKYIKIWNWCLAFWTINPYVSSYARVAFHGTYFIQTGEYNISQLFYPASNSVCLDMPSHVFGTKKYHNDTIIFMPYFFHIISQNGDTALHISAALKRRKIAKLLVEGGIKTSLKNKVLNMQHAQKYSYTQWCEHTLKHKLLKLRDISII